jgi:hypothetical protein
MLKQLIRGAYHVAIQVPFLRGVSLSLRNYYRVLKGKPRLVHFERAVETLPAMPDKGLYDKLAALNVVDAVSAVIEDFYTRLGIDARNAPVIKRLSNARQAVASDIDIARSRSEGSVLVRFETAWQLYQSGKVEAAREEFGALLADDGLLRRARRNVYLREALIRSAEIVGREAELAGDPETALRVYERIMKAGGRGVIARRLALLLWRSGRIREAAFWAEKTVWSDHNLAAQSARTNPHLARIVEVLATPNADPQRDQR